MIVYSKYEMNFMMELIMFHAFNRSNRRDRKQRIRKVPAEIHVPDDSRRQFRISPNEKENLVTDFQGTGNEHSSEKCVDIF